MKIGSLIVLIIIVSIQGMAQHVIPLSDNWQMRKAGDQSWMPATVPGCVHTDLLANNAIPDPFIGTNEDSVQWIEREDWEYTCTFTINNKLLHHDFQFLHFEGLDTYADVYLNDSLILQSENMFRSYRIDVRELLHKGDNTLRIYFHSPVNKAALLQAQYPVPLPQDERVFVRKAQYQFGWDWGPRLVTSGIWKPVTLEFDDDLRVRDASFQYTEKENNVVQGMINLSYTSTTVLPYIVTIVETTTGQILFEEEFSHQLPTQNAIPFTFTIPSRWQPYGYGAQSLYHFEVRVHHRRKNYFTKTFSTGFSNIQLHQENDATGSSFYFTVNGEKVFIKGANFIPVHSFPTAATRAQYLNLLSSSREMHINMIRIWGGGIYENEWLYDICDSLGIMVWQDFMYACGMYPDQTVQQTEYNQQVQRLKDHPCIALWCGNNEIDEGWNNWGWQKKYAYTDQDSAWLQSLNIKTFRQQIPEVLFQQQQVKQSYHPSSPTYGWGRKESLTQGDAHYWGVWWGKQPFSTYNKKVPRFMSEYGFQGMPSFSTYQKCTPENQLYLGSPSLKQHQKHPTGFETIAEYMARDFIIPTELKDYIYVSQLLQANGMRVAIEAHRRNMPYCMGTMFWQLNDCWPVASWSVIDYYGDRKAAFYTVKQCYADVMISVLQEDQTVSTWLVNDTPSDMPLTLKYALMTFDGRIIRSDSLPVQLKANSSVQYSELDIKWFLNGYEKNDVVLSISLSDADGQIIAERQHVFVRPADLALKTPEITIDFDAEKPIITITANTFVKNLQLYTDNGELQLSDNFFDLLPNTPKQISLQELPASGLNTLNLRYRNLNTLYAD